jgi:hypothetical protein
MRAADIRRFPWTRYDGERVQIRSQKTGKLLWIPATRELKAHLDGLDRRGALIILTPTGRAYSKRYFNEHWREDANAVGAQDLNFHDNRGTAATLLAEAGATAPEIAETLTWTVDRAQRVIDAYLARPGVLAANAIESLRITSTGRLEIRERPPTEAALVIVLGPSAVAAPAFKYADGEAPKRVHHFVHEFRLSATSAAALFSGPRPFQFVAAEIVHVRPHRRKRQSSNSKLVPAYSN